MRQATCDAVVLQGFDEAPSEWNELLRRGGSDVVFLTREWQEAWWDVYGRGTLLIVVGLEDGCPVAVAPFFADGGMLFFVGSGGSDYLDFVGDVSNPGLLAAMLGAAREVAPGFLGFRLYHVPDHSPTSIPLARAAASIGLACFDEGSLPAPVLDLTSSEDATAAAGKKSLVRHERSLAREGKLEIEHLRVGREILPHLDEFFLQHIERWSRTPFPSLFLDHAHRRFFGRVTERASEAGWLRFTRIAWDGSPIAFHWGTSYRGRYLWYKPTFAIEHARRSPGEVLLRAMLLSAGREEASIFDFGLGDEVFKYRFATRTETVTTWGLYPAETSAGSEPRR